MRIPPAPDKYSKTDQDSLRRALQDADRANQKKGEEIIVNRLIMTDTADSKQYLVTLTGGALVFNAL